MEKQEVSWYQAFRAWWYFTWRAMLAGILGGGAAGFVIGFVMRVMGASMEIIQTVTGFTGMIIGIFVSIFVIKMLLSTEFKTFRIRIEDKNTSDIKS